MSTTTTAPQGVGGKENNMPAQTDSPQVKGLKPGWKTSEFWITIGGNVAALVATVSEVLDPKIGGILMLLVNGFYTLSRGIAKK